MANVQHDLIVIGSGPGGYVAAIRAGQLGLDTLVIEKDPNLGGTCLLRGCIPTKALLHTADLLQHARDGAKFGVVCGEVTLDLKAAHAHKDRVVLKNSKGVEFLFKKNKVAWVQGTGRLLGKGVVEITRADGSVEQRRATHIVLATGSMCGDLPHIKADGESIINSDHALKLAEVPGRLLVLGAGAVGMEFASIFHRFGAKVTVVELLDRVLPLEDADVSAEVAKSFRKQGITIHTATRVEEVKVEGGVVHARAVTAKGETLGLEADKLLLGVGRVAVFKGIGLESTQGPGRARPPRRRRVLPHPRAGCVRHRRPHQHAVAGARRLDGRAHGRRAPGREEPAADRLPPGPELHLLLPRGRLDRPHRGAGQGEGATTSRPARSPSPRSARRRSSASPAAS